MNKKSLGLVLLMNSTSQKLVWKKNIYSDQWVVVE